MAVAIRRTRRSVAALALTTAALGACGPRPDAAPTPTTAGVSPPPTAAASPSAEPTPTVRPSPSPSPSPSPAPPASPSAPAPEAVLTAPAYADAAALVDVLAAAEAAIRDPATPDDEVRGWAWAQQAAYRRLVGQPDLREPVYAALPSPLQPVARTNVDAGAELRLLTDPRDELPPWTIIAPPPADELRAHYGAAQDEFGIDWTYLAAIHLVETRMGRIRGTSTAGAEGPMQFLPSTWEQYGEGDINDPRDAILAAGRYLAAAGAPADMGGALFAYNHSDHYVRAIEAYAGLMRDDERAFRGYYHWQVYYRLVSGDVLLPEGYSG